MAKDDDGPGFLMRGARPIRTHLKLSLVENGIDFVRSGIEGYFLRDTPLPRDHKYAVLHVFAGVLLLMKARLAKAHPSLIFVRVEDVDREDAVTVNFKQVVERLINIAKVDLTKHMPVLERVQRIRNRLEHYEVSLELKETQELVGALCTVAFLFLRDELEVDLEQHLKRNVWERVYELQGIAEAMAERWRAEWKKKVDRYSKLNKRQLEAMWQKAHSYDNNDVSACDYLECPQCRKERIVIPEDGLALCANPDCGEIFRLDECTRCYRPIVEGAFCPECQDYVDAQ
jgi:hypothetical protein